MALATLLSHALQCMETLNSATTTCFNGKTASDLTASIDLSVLQERLTNMINLGHVLSNAAFNKLIAAFCKSGNYAKVSALLHTMIAKNCSPNIHTYQKVIHGTGNIEEAEKLYKNMCERGYGETTMSYNTMISGLCFNGKLDEARVLFEKCIVRDIITYNYLIQGFCKKGKILEGICLLGQLLKEGLQPSTASLPF
ncbi:Pentatricopeptide repeat-containing protein [Forsythia ovata]|uniref:Pentatricopeptide repeat-containing protein n=1 Tax=Forsythia ovata TaxID=205694 RepID=A0ABD1V075_9LAMI